MTERFQYRVDEVSAHRVAGVESDEQLIIILDLICHIEQIDVEYSTATFSHLLGNRHGLVEQLLFDSRQ